VSVDGGLRDASPATALATVELWTIALDGAPDPHEVERLPADERWRAGEIVVPAVRRRFVRARSALRRILGRRLGVAPHALAFAYGPSGKPLLAEHPGLHFNLSHSADFAVLALSTDGEVGVDVESTRHRSQVLPVALRFFADDEAAAVAACEGEAQVAAFLRTWTRKESVLKATGRGMGVDTRAIAVGATRCAPRLRVDFDPRELLLTDLDLGPGRLAALCVAPIDPACGGIAVRLTGHLAPGPAGAIA
jgi:4'-phosphopantetheinyl transferase